MNIVIKNVRIIDGKGNVINNGFIEFDEERIIDVSEKPLHSSFEIDGSGKTVMPGLINCHVHLAMMDVLSGFAVIAADNETMTAVKAAAQCLDYLKFGITTIRNMGTKFDSDIYLRDLIEAGIAKGPRIIPSGQIISITGGHGHGIALESDTVDEALTSARKQIKKGAQVLKLMATGGVLTKGSEVGAQQLSYDQMKVVVEEALRTGRITGAHCIGYEGTKAAISAGADSVEHGYLLEEDLVEIMIERGTYFCPTVLASRAIALSEDESPIAKGLRKKIAPIADGHLEALEKSVKSGVKIAAGTDTGTPWNPVGGLRKELKYYIEAGMTNMEAIMSATKTASELLKIDNIVGTLEKDKLADLVIIDGNPLEDIEELVNVERTYISGKLVYEKASKF